MSQALSTKQLDKLIGRAVCGIVKYGIAAGERRAGVLTKYKNGPDDEYGVISPDYRNTTAMIPESLYVLGLDQEEVMREQLKQQGKVGRKEV